MKKIALFAMTMLLSVMSCQKTNKPTDEPEPEATTLNGHEFVDLGLSVKWATMNVGAKTPQDYGDYFAWGEVSTKTLFEWETYRYYSNSTLTGYNDSYDLREELQKADDAAFHNWGEGWRIPTVDECNELIEKCTFTWLKADEGGPGNLVTGPNGKSIFIPTSGYKYKMETYDAEEGFSRIWTNRVVEYNKYNAYVLSFDFGQANVTGGTTNRCSGVAIRAVTK